MFDSDTEDDPPSDVAPFVGRDQEREEIKQILGHSSRAVQLIGQPMVGKGRLAETISAELQQEMGARDKRLVCYHLCCRDVTGLPDLLACLSACLSLNDTAETEAALIKNFQAIVANNVKCFHLFVLLKCENVHKNNLYVQFVDIVKKLMEVSKRVFVIITTQQPFNITLTKRINISPLSKEDTLLLVRRYAPDIDVDCYSDAIEKNCMGLPPLAMDAAMELVKAKDISYTPDEFDQLLSAENRSKRIHSNNDILNFEAMRQFEGLNEYLKQRIVDISIFKGSFRVDYVLGMLGNTRVEAKKNLIEMKSSGLVEYDVGGQRMHLQSVIAHYVRNLMGSHVAYDDTVRLRFVTLFVDVLKKADTELFIKPQQTVFGYLHDDWPNLKQVLEEAIHCTENTYPAFLQVAISAENLLVKCFPGEAVKFYEAMMYSASKFGSREECAMQKWLLGMAKTIGKGTDLVDAMGLFKEALPILKDAENPEALVSLLADMGLNYNRQGKNGKSRNYYLQALEESGRCCDGRKLTNRVVNIRCYLAIPLIFLEHYDEAEDLLKETLEETKKCAPYHPSIPIMINSLGLIYERSGRDDDEALRYYTNSLYERRKYADVAPGDLVVVLNNVGMQHSKRGNHDYALQLLSEAREIRMKIDRINYHTALTCWNMGQVYARKGETKSALREVKDALEVFKKCTKDHFVIVEVLLLAAHLAASQNSYTEAENYLLDALQMEDRFKEHVPSSVHILLVLQHLVMVYLKWKPKCSPFLDRAVAEVTRLADLTRPNESMERYERYMQQKETLFRIRAALDQQCVTDNKLNELLHEVIGLCYICDEFSSRGEDMVRLFHSMTTNIYGALAGAETLLRSNALRVATQVLRNASGTSDSPPVSPTQELYDPPSFYMNNYLLGQSPGHSSIRSPFFIENDTQHYHMTPSDQPLVCAELRHSQTYHKRLLETRPYKSNTCTEHADTSRGNFYHESSSQYNAVQNEHIARSFVHLEQTEQFPFTLDKAGSGFERQTERYPSSLGINVTQLQGKCDDVRREETPQEQNLEKQKTVEDTLPAPYQKPPDHCSFDPTMRYPPQHTFPTLGQLAHSEGISVQRRTQGYHSNIMEHPLHEQRSAVNVGHTDFHAKYNRYASLCRDKANGSPPGSCETRRDRNIILNGVERTSTSSGYDSSANAAADERRPNNRLSQASQISSAPASAACSKSASEHDDRRQGSRPCCNQPDCSCSLSGTK